ncbi:UNVERIFIED_CONTAM: hypothetical protein Sangu_0974400 [Sesamum angustifolium]|uniref:Uncharacterized protein n=1 Tax=Sesamum angustifolium TaxID=2727405 RepID=A0AAW2PH48_9LAMI
MRVSYHSIECILGAAMACGHEDISINAAESENPSESNRGCQCSPRVRRQTPGC